MRRRNGWTLGEKRDDQNRNHPMLLPYAELPDITKERDRAIVMAYPDRLEEAGYVVTWLTLRSDAGAAASRRVPPPATS